MPTKNAEHILLQEKVAIMVLHALILTHMCSANPKIVYSLWIVQARGRNMALASTKQTPTRTGAADCTRSLSHLPTTDTLAHMPTSLSSALLINVPSLWTVLELGKTMEHARTMSFIIIMSDAVLIKSLSLL